ncbi:MAG: excinuclease ABC subunit UvrC [Burkholderiales bacterium]|jgi:excinuclease ABC subunit C|nr:excinuclease ABC subunit UvrC [Burkholderiales bacterium]
MSDCPAPDTPTTGNRQDAVQNTSSNAAFDARAVVASLPQEPGVYRMFSSTGQTLYVGKALNLKKRVSSYFQKTDLPQRIRLMVSQIARLETTVTRSEAEALLLENNLIKSLAPRYNILFRDDKSHPYLCLTSDPFPQIRLYRGTLNKKNRYFGPYPNAGAVREGIALLQKAFQLRTCENTVFAHRSRPCMLYQIERCTAPCVGYISADAYAADVEAATLFLQGKINEIQESLQKQMDEAAAQLAFERAAVLRDKLQRVQQLRAQQFVESSKTRDADVIAVVAEQGIVAVNQVMIRGGRHVGDRTFFPAQATERRHKEIIDAFLAQHYLEKTAPPLLVLDGYAGNTAFTELLSAQAGYKVALITRPVGEKRVWIRMAAHNAQLAIAQKLTQKATLETRLQSLRQALSLPDLQRIECFDVSHTMGEATVASCVVFDQGTLRNNEYRRFNVAPPVGGDDYAAMREALRRRAARIVKGESPTPDLWVIDGGKGQLGVAAQVLEDEGLNFALISLGKGPERKVGDEDIWIPDQEQPLRLPPEHPGFQLLHQIRDEAHRFAIQGHRARRAKTRLSSSLEEIAGIGDKRRRELLNHFGGLKGVRAASVDDLARVSGISRALAQRIYAALHEGIG